ncbi:uncharacterized protein G2W53_006618 [Senna tora]|uniref:Uncharacterized protein n=1 Tax=Senna tora TaxID=362788 RepID=A0A835CCN8_9FABA|nr:uncharacterized protein G2W53_006618 [Senna tora]
MMKKMKGVAPYAVYEDQRARVRHQSLLLDYQELQMETDYQRDKLEILKQMKMRLSAEVRFLRQRYKYLMKHPLPKPDVPQPSKVKNHATTSKGRNYNRKESASRPPLAPHSDPRQRVSNGVEVTLQKPLHVFDLNQNARNFSGKDASFHSSTPMLDLNQKDRIHSGKEAATKKSITPFFDLNQISREEEELQGDVEPVKIEEPKKITFRGLSDDQHNDIKLSVCRNVGDGSNRAGKRKISWQDQVALRV